VSARVAFEVAVVLALVRLRHQLAHVTADDLVGRVAEDTLGRETELLYDPATVDHDDRVHRRVEQRAEIPLAVRASAAWRGRPPFLGGLALSHGVDRVRNCQCYVNWRSGTRYYW